MATISEIYRHLNTVLPSSLSCDWDNDGLMVASDPNREVVRVLCALDVTGETVNYAIANGYDVIVSHHPMLFHPLKTLSYADPVARRAIKLLKHNISVMSFHTRLDAAPGGLNDIFANQGITEYVYTESNADGMSRTSQYQSRDFNGLCFVNLVDFDMTYGHRRDRDGYARALTEFDGWLGSFITNMNSTDALIITADHGCDPDYKGTDHTRECVPFILYTDGIEPKSLGTIQGFDYIASTVKELLKG